MAIYSGSNLVKKVYYGTTPYNKVYRGSTLLYTGYEPETVALIARMDEQPNVALKELINTTIKGLKDDGVWQLADCLYIRGVHTSQAATLNWIKNAHNSTLVNSPSFIIGMGFKGDGISTYINNNFKPKSQGNNVKHLDSSYAIMNHKACTLVGKYEAGCYDNVNVYRYYIWSSSTSNERGYTGTADYNNNSNCGDGDFILYNSKDSVLTDFKNGIKGIDKAVGNNANIPDANICDFTMMIPNNTVSGAYSDSVRFFSWNGKYLTDDQQLALYTRIKYFNDNFLDTYDCGSEMVLNGTFDSYDNWYCNAPWSIGEGKAIYNDVSSNTMDQVMNFTLGKFYRVQFEISDATANVNINWKNQSGSPLFAGDVIKNGVYDRIKECISDSTKLRIEGHTSSSSSWKLDNLSIKEVSVIS